MNVCYPQDYVQVLVLVFCFLFFFFSQKFLKGATEVKILNFRMDQAKAIRNMLGLLCKSTVSLHTEAGL